MPTLLSPREVAAALELRDLSDPATGPHAMQALLTGAVEALAARWNCPTAVSRPAALVAVEDNYDRLGYDRAAITRDGRYTRYVSDTVMLRSHTSAGVPPALRALAADPAPPGDVLLVLPGLAYRRDAIDRLHVGTPHQVDLWRIVRGRPLTTADLDDMIATVVPAVLPDARWRTVAAEHPYTEHGLQVDVLVGDGGGGPASIAARGAREERNRSGPDHRIGPDHRLGWVEVAECGLAAPHVLAGAGLSPGEYSGLALGMGLDRALMLRKGIPDIRLLRAGDPRITAQLLDLAPWRAVSTMPPVSRDLSIVTDADVDDELLGDRARHALGAQAELLESLTVCTVTGHDQLPNPVRRRLGTRPGQANALVRIVLRPLDRTLTDAEANVLRDRVYAALGSPSA